MTLQNPVGPDPFIVRTINPANPANGTSFSENVPPNTRIEIISMQATLVTDDNTQNRLLVFHGHDGFQTFCDSAPPHRQVNALRRKYSMSSGNLNIDQATLHELVFGAISDKFFLNIGDTIRITVENIQAGDQLITIIIRFKQWITEN